jgi:hypothetical protein
LVEAYAIHLRSQNLSWEQPFYQRYDKKLHHFKRNLSLDHVTQRGRIHMYAGKHY